MSFNKGPVIQKTTLLYIYLLHERCADEEFLIPLPKEKKMANNDEREKMFRNCDKTTPFVFFSTHSTESSVQYNANAFVPSGYYGTLSTDEYTFVFVPSSDCSINLTDAEWKSAEDNATRVYSLAHNTSTETP